MKRALVAFVLLVATERTASAANACVSAADKGQDLRAVGKLDEARATFLVCAKPACNRVVRADCERWIKEIDEEMAAPPPAPVPSPAASPPATVVEDKPVRPTPPQPALARVVVVEGRHPAPVPVSSMILGGVGALSFVAFGWFQLQGWSGHAALEQGCARTQSCTDADIDPVRSQFVASGVALGVSVVSLGAAAVLYFTRGTTTPSRVGITPAGAAISF